MLDLKAIREDPDRFRAGLARREMADSIDRLLELDVARREQGTKIEDLRSLQNKASKQIGGAQGDEKQRLIDEVAQVSAQIKRLEPQLAETERELNDLLAVTPNVPDESAPDGFTDEDALEIKQVGQPPMFDFEVRDHVALGELLGVLDTERGARTSGSRFVYLLGSIVMVQFALVRHALDILVAKGFTPVIPPVLVREEAMIGTGFLPDAEGQVYSTQQQDLFLVGTSEVPLAAFHMEEILDAGALPLRYAGYSTCFRREAGSAGKDLGGMFRVHQFDKVEMFSFVEPDASWEEHDFILSVEEEIIGNLEIPYRVVNIAAGDLGGSAAKKFDIEGWLPGQGRYRELTSCSNCTDY
ncbi:MAG: serine--tRNA ligase, partial [Actinomycetota bacterium]